MLTKCIKLTILPIDEILNKNQIYQELRDISYKTRKACNIAINLQYQDLMRKTIENEQLGEVRKDKEVYGQSFSGWLYHQISKYMGGCYSKNIAQTNQFVTSKSNFDTVKILKGEESLTSFKKNVPIFVCNQSYKLEIDSDNKYCIDVGLFNKEKQKELGCKRIKFAFVKPDDNCKATLNKIMRNEYKQGFA